MATVDVGRSELNDAYIFNRLWTRLADDPFISKQGASRTSYGASAIDAEWLAHVCATLHQDAWIDEHAEIIPLASAMVLTAESCLKKTSTEYTEAIQLAQYIIKRFPGGIQKALNVSSQCGAYGILRLIDLKELNRRYHAYQAFETACKFGHIKYMTEMLRLYEKERMMLLQFGILGMISSRDLLCSARTNVPLNLLWSVRQEQTNAVELVLTDALLKYSDAVEFYRIIRDLAFHACDIGDPYIITWLVSRGYLGKWSENFRPKEGQITEISVADDCISGVIVLLSLLYASLRGSVSVFDALLHAFYVSKRSLWSNWDEDFDIYESLIPDNPYPRFLLTVPQLTEQSVSAMPIGWTCLVFCVYTDNLTMFEHVMHLFDPGAVVKPKYVASIYTALRRCAPLTNAETYVKLLSTWLPKIKFDDIDLAEALFGKMWDHVPFRTGQEQIIKTFLERIQGASKAFIGKAFYEMAFERSDIRLMETLIPWTSEIPPKVLSTLLLRACVSGNRAMARLLTYDIHTRVTPTRMALAAACSSDDSRMISILSALPYNDVNTYLIRACTNPINALNATSALANSFKFTVDDINEIVYALLDNISRSGETVSNVLSCAYDVVSHAFRHSEMKLLPDALEQYRETSCALSNTVKSPQFSLFAYAMLKNGKSSLQQRIEQNRASIASCITADVLQQIERMVKSLVQQDPVFETHISMDEMLQIRVESDICYTIEHESSSQHSGTFDGSCKDEPEWSATNIAVCPVCYTTMARHSSTHLPVYSYEPLKLLYDALRGDDASTVPICNWSSIVYVSEMRRRNHLISVHHLSPFTSRTARKSCTIAALTHDWIATGERAIGNDDCASIYTAYWTVRKNADLSYSILTSVTEDERLRAISNVEWLHCLVDVKEWPIMTGTRLKKALENPDELKPTRNELIELSIWNIIDCD